MRRRLRMLWSIVAGHRDWAVHYSDGAVSDQLPYDFACGLADAFDGEVFFNG